MDQLIYPAQAIHRIYSFRSSRRKAVSFYTTRGARNAPLNVAVVGEK
jgi:hypothetical protein